MRKELHMNLRGFLKLKKISYVLLTNISRSKYNLFMDQKPLTVAFTCADTHDPTLYSVLPCVLRALLAAGWLLTT